MRYAPGPGWTAYWDKAPVVHSGERYMVVMPTQWDRASPRRLVVRTRGGATSTISTDQAYCEHWAKAGFVVIDCDLGSPNAAAGLYGNDTVLARLAEAWAWAKANLAVKTDNFILSGGSRGTVDALNYLTRNASQVAACTLEIPVCDAEDVRANNRSGQQAVIEAAYTNNAGWQAARPTRNPVEIASAVGATGVPGHIWSSSDDNIALPGFVDTFVSGSGWGRTVFGAVGHSTSGLNLPDLSAWAALYA